jgi:hypothetical protein
LNAHGDEDGAPSTMGVLSLAPIVKMKSLQSRNKNAREIK